MSLFSQLAVSLVYDLGLTKSVPRSKPENLWFNPKYSSLITPRTMEERRAVLGCYLITSTYATQ
jgi:hypothetical protein